MAYTAPKWTQMVSPSGATSVNAITAAGDLFSKAMDSASKGLKDFDTGVETRRQDDSDVNTAALRRQLEGASSLDELNAMKSSISAEGLQEYDNRIDRDALDQSFDKERGVLRGEDEQQYNEQFQQKLNDANSIEEYTNIRNSMASNPTWYDDALRIQSLGVGMEGARTLEANTASTALSQSFAGKSFNELADMAKLIKPGDLNAREDLAAIATQQKLVRSNTQTDYDISAEKSLLAAAKDKGRGGLEAELKRLTNNASKPGSKINLTKVLSAYQGLVAGANETTATNTVVGAVSKQSNMFETNDAAILSVVEGLGAEQYVTVNPVTGQPTFRPGTPEAIRNNVINRLADAGYTTPPKGVANKTEFVNNLLEQGIPLKIANEMYADTDTTLANTYELTGAGKIALTKQTAGFTSIKDRAIADATNIRDAERLKSGNAAQNIADAIEGPREITDWINSRMTRGGMLDYSSNEDAGEVLPTIKKLLKNGIGDPSNPDTYIAGVDIDTSFIKLVLAQNADNVGNYKGDLDEIGKLVLKMQKDNVFNGQVQRVLAVENTYLDSVTNAESAFTSSISSASTELKLKYNIRSTTNMNPSIAQMVDETSKTSTTGDQLFGGKKKINKNPYQDSDASLAAAMTGDGEITQSNSNTINKQADAKKTIDKILANIDEANKR